MQSAKDNEFAGRYVFVRPLNVASLEEQLKASGQDESAAHEAAEGAKAILEKMSSGSDESGLFDKVQVDNGPESTMKMLEAYIYGLEEEEQKNDEKMADDEAAATSKTEVAQAVDGESVEEKEEDATMEDAGAPAAAAAGEGESKETE